MIVVSAGVKGILDVPKTLEFLETLVSLWSVTKRTHSHYSIAPEVPIEVNLTINSPEEALLILKEKERLGIDGAVLVANPIPENRFDGLRRPFQVNRDCSVNCRS